jgi:hypothetical protein
MPDGKGSMFKIKNETCYAFGFYGAASGLVSNHILDQTTKCTLFVDEQNTKFNLFGLQSARLVDLIKATGLVPTKLGFEPLLLDFADLIAYCTARALSGYTYRNKLICTEVYNVMEPVLVHLWWNPQDRLNSLIAPRLGLDVPL